MAEQPKTGNIIDTSKPRNEHRVMFGRRKIYANVLAVTSANVVQVIKDAMEVHSLNRDEIDYLWKYYKGNQPILNRIKEVRPEINNKLVENRANEIVAFKTGYLCGEPIQYVSRTKDESVVDGVNTLNEFMALIDKPSCDQSLIEWQNICGTAYRGVLPESRYEKDSDYAPFCLYTFDPRNTFVVYSTEVDERPLLGVKYYVDNDTNVTHITAYTESEWFLIEDDSLKDTKPHVLGEIPIIEYPANNAMLGAFEIVLPLLDAINDVESNRIDGVEQLIQAFIKFVNCDIDKDEYKKFIEMGAIKVKSEDGQQADVDVITSELDQVQTQTLKDDLYNAILTICGMPNRNGGSSTSDTGAAVILRDGWSASEARAKDSEHMIRRSENKSLRIVLTICRNLAGLQLKLKDIVIKFTRRNYENIQSKSQVLVTMLGCEKIHPQLAFQSCGIFPDSESAYTKSMEYYETQEKKREEKEQKALELANKGKSDTPPEDD